MQVIVAVLGLFALSLNAQVTEPSDWESLMAHKDSERELRSAPTITVQSTNRKEITLRVENRTGIDLVFRAYAYGTKKTPQTFYKEKRDGKWVATSWEWCGTGLQKHIVKNQTTITIEVHQTDTPVQIFTVFRNAHDPTEFSLIKLYEWDFR